MYESQFYLYILIMNILKRKLVLSCVQIIIRIKYLKINLTKEARL